IMMSSSQPPEAFEAHSRLKTRADDYLRKPISFSDLLARIQPFVALGQSSLSSTVMMSEDAGIEFASVEDAAPGMQPPPSFDGDRTGLIAGGDIDRAVQALAPGAPQFLQYGLGEGDEDEATGFGGRAPPEAARSPMPAAGMPARAPTAPVPPPPAP